MKLKRKVLSAILAATFILLCSSTVFAQEYVLVYDDIEDKDKLILPYTIADTIPEECGNYFEELLKNSVSSTYAGARAYDYFVIGDTFGFTAESFGSNFANYTPEFTSIIEIVYVKDMYLIAAILEKDSGSILGLELLGQHFDNVQEHRDKMFKLPDYFDYEKHQVAFFNYVVDFNMDENGDLAKEPKIYVYDPVYVDVGKYIYGDANKDGKVNLTDITLMLKYMARWSNVKVDKSLRNKEYSHYADYNCWYNMPGVTRVLKIIAGWNATYTSNASHAAASCAAWYIETK